MKPYFISVLEQRWIGGNKDKLSVDSQILLLLCNVFFFSLLQNNSLSLGKQMSNQYHYHMSVLHHFPFQPVNGKLFMFLFSILFP